jgi:hypothetical protein
MYFIFSWHDYGKHYESSVVTSTKNHFEPELNIVSSNHLGLSHNCDYDGVWINKSLLLSVCLQVGLMAQKNHVDGSAGFRSLFCCGFVGRTTVIGSSSLPIRILFLVCLRWCLKHYVQQMEGARKWSL